MSIWERVCQNLDDLTANHLQSAESVAISVPNHLVVKFPSHYTFQKDACERPERRNKLEEELYRTTGNRFRVTFELLPQSSQPQPVVQDSGVKTARQRRREAEQHPMVQQVDGNIRSRSGSRRSFSKPPISLGTTIVCPAEDYVVLPTVACVLRNNPGEITPNVERCNKMFKSLGNLLPS